MYIYIYIYIYSIYYILAVPDRSCPFLRFIRNIFSKNTKNISKFYKIYFKKCSKNIILIYYIFK